MAASKVVLITGASAGIGQACADRLHGAGWTVVGASRRVAASLGGSGASAGWQVLRMDVDDDAEVRRGVGRVLEEHGRLDAVVASAGFGVAGPVETTPLHDAKAQLETNFWGVVPRRAVRPALHAATAERPPGPDQFHRRGDRATLPGLLRASKFALEGYAEALAYEVEPFGIEVTLVEPGNIRTEIHGAPAEGRPRGSGR